MGPSMVSHPAEHDRSRRGTGHSGGACPVLSLSVLEGAVLAGFVCGTARRCCVPSRVVAQLGSEEDVVVRGVWPGSDGWQTSCWRLALPRLVHDELDGHFRAVGAPDGVDDALEEGDGGQGLQPGPLVRDVLIRLRFHAPAPVRLRWW